MLNVPCRLSLLEGPIDGRAAGLQGLRNSCNAISRVKRAQIAALVSSLFDIPPSVQIFAICLLRQLF